MSTITKEFNIKKYKQTEITSISAECSSEESKLINNKLYLNFTNEQTVTKTVSFNDYINVNFYLENDNLFFDGNGVAAPVVVNDFPVISDYNVPEASLEGGANKYIALDQIYECIENGVGFGYGGGPQITKNKFLWANSTVASLHNSGVDYANNSPVAIFRIDIKYRIPIRTTITGVKTYIKNGEELNKYTYEYKNTHALSKVQSFWVVRDRTNKDDTTTTGYYLDNKFKVGSYAPNSAFTSTHQLQTNEVLIAGLQNFTRHNLGLSFTMDSERYEKALATAVEKKARVMPKIVKYTADQEELFLDGDVNLGYHVFGNPNPITQNEINNVINTVKRSAETAINSFLLAGPYAGYHERKDDKNKIINEHNMNDGNIKDINTKVNLISNDNSYTELRDYNNRIKYNGLTNNCEYYTYTIDLDSVSIATDTTQIERIELYDIKPSFNDVELKSTIDFINKKSNHDYETAMSEYITDRFGPEPTEARQNLQLAAKDTIKKFLASSDSNTLNTKFLESYNNIYDRSLDIDVAKIKTIKDNDHLDNTWEFVP